jgi:endo-1,4-beta-xylanase
VGGSKTAVSTILCLAGLVLVLGAADADAVVTEDCALPGSDCSIADVARQAHVFVGAITNQYQTAADRALLAAHFNATTPENEMKWGVIAPTVGSYDFAPADAIAEFASANALRLRGHTLVWGRLQLPQDLAAQVAAAPDPAAHLRALMMAHFETMIGRYGDRVRVWDVVNEPLAIFSGAYDANIFYQTLGPGYVADAFTLARALDPDAELFLNEFFLTLPGEKADAFVTLVRDLRAAGVPIDGVGIQAHFFPGLPLVDPAALATLVQSLGDLGVKVELTEVDVSLWHFRNDPDPLARQAEFFGRVATACLEVPACQAITFWGLIDSETWLDTFPPFDAFKPNAPVLFDGARAPKPAYFAVRDAVAARAVPFRDQAAALLARYDESAQAGTLVGSEAGREARHALRQGRGALARALRLLARARFAAACERLGRVGDVLALATGVSAPSLRDAVLTLRTDLRCDEP